MTTPHITIKKLNATYMTVECAEPYIEMDIADKYSFQVEGAKFDPRVRKGLWDGYKRLFNKRYKRLYVGLLNDLLMFCEKRSYTYKVDPELLSVGDISKDDVVNLVDNVIKPQLKGKQITPYDYQLDAVVHMLQANRSLVLASTSAGKSLIIAMLARIYQLLDEFDGKHILIIVPYVSLVEQLYGDFEEYSDDNWNVSTHVQKLSGKYDKIIKKQIVITTWQSLSKMNLGNFLNDGITPVGAVIIDEVQSIKGTVLGKIIEQLSDTHIRHGLTGTLDGLECNELQAQGLLGPAKRVVSAKELIKDGRAAKLNIKPIILNHKQETKKEFFDLVSKFAPQKKYQAEIEFLNNHTERNNLILNMIRSLDGNKLVLFDRVESYGMKLYEQVKAVHENTFLIVGDVDVKEREEIRQSLEGYNDAIIFASFGTTSTGTNMPKLHHAFLASSTKSKVRLLQSIGRMMRLHESKDGEANIYDIVDNLQYGKFVNYTLKHFEERLIQYSNEGHKVEFLNLDL